MRTYDQSGDQVTDHDRLFDRVKDDCGHRRYAKNQAQIFKESMRDELEQHLKSPDESPTRFAYRRRSGGATASDWPSF
jgi:hypothetical protein